MTQTVPALDQIERRAAECRLELLGAFNVENGDPDLPPGTASLILLGPLEPGFWRHVTTSTEFLDGAPDPLDRWSRRTIGAMAGQLDGHAILPSDGPPYAPFYQWALRTGRFWVSPIRMLVHQSAGLLVSMRGAIALSYALDSPPRISQPCATCPDQPCRSACPVNALTDTGFDTDACHGFLDTPAGTNCMENGCAARLACPISRRYPRQTAQSAFHMRAFHGAR